MEINKFMQFVLEELQSVKGNKYKKKYLVDEVEFVLSLTVSNDRTIGVKVLGVGANIGDDKEIIQKVTIKLKPKNTLNERISIEI